MWATFFIHCSVRVAHNSNPLEASRTRLARGGKLHDKAQSDQRSFNITEQENAASKQATTGVYSFFVQSHHVIVKQLSFAEWFGCLSHPKTAANRSHYLCSKTLFARFRAFRALQDVARRRGSWFQGL
jgi:hypothetical protein